MYSHTINQKYLMKSATRISETMVRLCGSASRPTRRATVRGVEGDYWGTPMKFVLVARKLRKTAELSGTEVPELQICAPDSRHEMP